MVHFKLNTMSGNTTIRIDVDESAAMGTLIRLVEMVFKAEIRGKGQVEEKLDFHVDGLFCSFGSKGEKMVQNMRLSAGTVGEHFEAQVSAMVMMGKTLAAGDEEREDGQSLFDWTRRSGAGVGEKRAAESDGGGAAKKAKNGVAAENGAAASDSEIVDEMTFFSLEDNAQVKLPLGRQDDGSVDLADLVRKIENAYVDNRKAITTNDAFGLWEGERPIEITALIFFGLKDRSGGSYVKTIEMPFPAKLLPAGSEAPAAAEVGVPLDMQAGDYVAFRFRRNARAAQTVSAFPQGFVRSMNALATMAGDTSKPSSRGASDSSTSAPLLEFAKELIMNKLKGHPQLLKVWKDTIKVSEGGRVVVLDPSTAVGAGEGSGQVVLTGCCVGPWRVGTLCTKFKTPTQILDSLIVCHEEYENVNGLSALLKKKGTSGWKKAGEVKVQQGIAGIFDEKEFQAPGDNEGSGSGAYPKLNFQPIAIFPDGTYGKRPNENETFPVYTKDRGGKIQAIKIMFLSGNDYK